ncbi:tetratricopeptide repeat protein [Anabaenopsis sp. FSS-46]|uniref:O-linked N-acetylglucosamine transferase family protein n=1 Tax=Anabaenopsis sp. FSS-46 TaxID=2971766 RepID=UPI0024756DA4|nr:tetratricopeptide repeat protein [Anabaenopsis sp. FSS-46]MDH6099187.1 tetratricopeptide repeat protein [Anabaenopsis sp. FSS-46]
MIIFCGGISNELRKLSYNLCNSLVTDIGNQATQGIACNTAPEIEAYFKLIDLTSAVTLVEYRVTSELVLGKIHQGEAKSIYVHQDPREILASLVTTPTEKAAFASSLLNLWQQYQEKWFPQEHTLFIARENLVSQVDLTITQLAEYLKLTLELTATDAGITLINQYCLPPATPWTQSLSPEQCLIIETLLQPLLIYFNYTDEAELCLKLEQHLAAIELPTLLTELNPILTQSISFKPTLREEFYDCLEEYLITRLTNRGGGEVAAEICHLFGNILSQQHELTLAEKWYLRAVSIQPQLAKSHHNLGLVYEQQHNWEAGINHHTQAIAIHPNYTKAHYRLGLIYRRQQQFTAAIGEFSQVLALDPGHQGAKFNLALIYEQENVDAIANLLEPSELELLPKLTNHINNTGTDLVNQGKLKEAQKCFEYVIELDPEAVLAYYNLGCIFQNEKYYIEAIYYYNLAVEIDPEYMGALKNLSYVYYQNGQPNLAQECIEKVLKINPQHSEIYELLGYFANDQGKILESINLFNEALKINPHHPKLHSSFLFNISALSNFTPQEILDSAELWYLQQVVNQWLPHIKNHPNPKTPHRPLRIGYISPDFRRHSVSAFIKPVIQHHDRSRVEVFCYGEVSKPDGITEEIINICDAWRSTVGMSDLEVAELIKSDRIDILVDLAGHTVSNRLVVLGMKPAPIQATYLGYFATTGLPTIDYWITDEVLHPPDTKEKTSETIWRLPRCYVSYEPLKDTPDITQLPYQKTGIFTFASFNTLRKLTPETLSLWTEILKAVPHSRLVIKCASSNVFNPLITEKIQTPFMKEGIDPKRIALYGGYAADQDHLNLYNQVDLHLDSIPYTGCTTTCEALWMGVPTLTLAGSRKMERMSASILHTLGLDDFIAHSQAEYVQKAVELAQNPYILANLRPTIRQRMEKSPLLDVENMARTLETSYQQMWETYLQQQSPNSICGELDAAVTINDDQEYITHHPDDAQAYYRLGLAYVASNDVEKAVSAYLQSLTLDRSCAVTYQALAQLLKEQKLIEEAEKYHRYASLLSINH